MKYFIYEEEWGIHWYAEKAAWEKAVDEFDFLGKFGDDGWSESVENCIAGIIPDGFKIDDDMDENDQLEPYALFTTEECDREARPEDIGDDGCSKLTGEYWGEWNFRCNYSFIPKVTG